MNKMIDKIIRSGSFQKKKNYLINLKFPSQLYHFSKLREKIFNFVIITNKKFIKNKNKKILILNLKSFFQNSLVFKNFISINSDINSEKFILKFIMKKPFSKIAFFFCNKKITNKIIIGHKNKNFFYIKILTRISILNENVNYISNPNTSQIFKFVTRKVLPIVNFFKWDCILKLFFSQKKKKMGKLITSKNFLRFLFQLMINNSRLFNSIIKIKDYFQRIYEETGILSSKMYYISIKDYFFLFNNF
nr:ribosomal RNA small subunit methyltransferase A [Cryptomonas curvata]